jgi:nucleoside-diphosphate-sugar epimerase
VWSRLGRLSTVSLRYFNVFGPGQRPESKYAAVFPAFISSLAAGRAPEVHWDGEQSRDFTYIDDVVRANLLAADADSRGDGEVVNIAGGDLKTVNEVLQAVASVFGTWIDPISLPKRPGDLRHKRADVSRAAAVLDWKPQSDWKRAVEATVSWFMSS